MTTQTTRQRLIAMLAATVLLCGGAAQAATLTWEGDGGGSGDDHSWNDKDNWGGTAPGYYDTLNITTTDTIDNVYRNAAGNTYYHGDTWRGTVHLNQGTITIDDDFCSGNTAVFNIGDGSGTADAVVNVTSGGYWQFDRHGNGTYRVNIKTDGQLNATGTGYFRNYGGHGGRKWIINVQGGSITSAAAWNMSDGSGYDANTLNLTNGGTVDVGAVTVHEEVIDFADTSSTSFTAKFGASFTNLAAVNTALGTTFKASGGGTLQTRDNSDGTFTVGIDLLDGTLTSYADGNWNTPGSWELDGGGAGNTQPPTADYATIVGAHTVTMAADGQAYSLQVDDAAGAVQVNSGRELTITAAVDIDQGSMTIDGTLSAATVNVAAGGTLDAPGTINADEVNTAGTTSLTGGGTVGTVTVTGGITTLSTPDINTLNVDGGEAVVGPTGLTTVTDLNVGPGGTVTAAGNLTAGDENLGGTINITDADISATTGTVTLNGTTLNSAGTVNVTGDVKISGGPDLNVSSGHLTISVPIGAAAPPVNPQAYYSFDNAADPGNDDSGGSADAALNNPVWVGGGKVGGALEFDSNDYANAVLNVSETAYAAAMWFRADADNRGIFSVHTTPTSGDCDRHIYLTGGNIGARIWNDETITTSGLNLADGEWHHVVHTYGGTEGGQKLYIDGQPEASGSKANSDYNWQSSITIGFSNDGANDWFDGLIDEVYLYDRALTAADAEALYNAGQGAGGAFGDLTMAAGAHLSLNSDGSGQASFQNIAAGDGAVVNGNVTGLGSVEPGFSVGTLNVHGNYTQAAGSTYVWEADTGGADRIAVTDGDLDASAAWNLEVTPLDHSLDLNQVLMSRTDTGGAAESTIGPPTAGTVSVALADNVYADLYDVSSASVGTSGDTIVLTGVTQNNRTVSHGGIWGNDGDWDNLAPDATKASVVAGGTVTAAAGGTAKDIAVAGGDLDVTAGTLTVSNNVRIGAGSELLVQGNGTPGSTHVSVGNEAKVYAGGTLHLKDGGTLGSAVRILDQGTLKTTGDMDMPDNVDLDLNSTLHVAGGTLTVGAGISVLLQDDFNDNSIDPAKWNVVLPRGGSSVTETGGRMRFNDRGYLNTAQQFDPTASGGLKITGVWQIGTDDFLQLLTRSDGTPGGSYSETNNGVELYVHSRNNTFQIRGRGGATVTGAVNGTLPGGMADGKTFYFELIDDGANLWATLTEAGNPTNTATATATCVVDMPTDLIVFHNREGGGGRVSFLDDVLITSGGAPILDYGNLVVDAGATLVNAAGGTLSFNDVSGGGTIQSDIEIRGTASPGDSPGDLTVTGDLTMADRSSLAWELGPGGGDTLDVGGALTFAGDWSLVLKDLGGAADLLDKFYLFAGFTGHSGIIVPTVDPGMVGPNWDVSGLIFDVDGGGLYMTGLSVTPGVTVIPEPMTMLAVGLGIASLGGYVRKRRRA